MHNSKLSAPLAAKVNQQDCSCDHCRWCHLISNSVRHPLNFENYSETPKLYAFFLHVTCINIDLTLARSINYKSSHTLSCLILQFADPQGASSIGDVMDDIFHVTLESLH